MTVEELIKELSAYPHNSECIMAINHSAGFPDDKIEIYPVEHTYVGSIDDPDHPYDGYFEDEENREKVFLYVHP